MSDALGKMETALGFVSLEKKSINKTGVLSNFSHLRDFINKSNAYTTNVLSLTIKEGLAPLQVSLANVLSPFKAKGYTSSREYRISKPIGLDVDAITYAKALNAATELVGGLLTKQLIPFNRWVVSALGNPETLHKFSSIEDYESFETSDISKGISKCFNPKNVTDTIKFGDFVGRVEDYKSLIKIVNELTIAFESPPIDHVLKKVDEIYKNVDMLMRRIEDDKSGDYKLSKASLGNLSDVLFEMAEAVKLYSVIRYRVITLATSISKDSNVIK